MVILQYYRIIRRWLWLIVFAVFMVSSLVYMLHISQQPYYSAHVTIAIGGYIESPNPDAQDIRTGLDLVQTYSHLVKNRNILQGVVNELELELELDELSNIINAVIVPGTSLLEVSVTDSDPIEASDIANEIARQLIIQSPTNLTVAQQQQVSLLNEQVTSLSNELESFRAQSVSLESRLLNEDLDFDERQALTEQRNFLLEQVNQSSNNIAQFTDTIASLQQRTNSVEIVESAVAPEQPIGISSLLIMGLTVALTALVTTGSIFLYEYVTDIIHSTDDAIQYLNLPLLGVITSFGNRKDDYQDRLISNLSPFSRTTQEFSTLRTNIIYSASKSKHTYIISSASPREGKSVTAMNLAMSSTLAGKRVLLLDADFRRPRIHLAFGLSNGKGLTTLLQSSPADSTNPEEISKAFLQTTSMPGLSILPSGHMPQNPSELLGFVRVRHWVEYFHQSGQFDMLIFDTAPILAVPDAAILAAGLNADVLLIVQANSTRRIEAQQAKLRFEQINVDIAGVILNQVNASEDHYYGYNYNDYYDPTEDQSTEIEEVGQ